jgi:multidrug efflux pump subunit AcrB
MEWLNLSALALRERALTMFLIIALALAGTAAFIRLGRAEDPSFTIKTMTISAVWPGASARDMQNLVADPLERRLQELRYYDRVETYTRPGFAFLILWVNDSTPPEAVPEQFYQARKKLGDEAHKLPHGVIGPFFNDEYSDVSFALYALQARGMPQRELVRTADALRQRLLNVPGVQKVDILGEQGERIYVDFDKGKLANLGLDPRAIAQSVRDQNEVVPAGAVETSGPRVLLRVDAGYDDVDAVRATTISTGGRSLRLGDIAHVYRGYEDPPDFVVHNDGERSLLLSVVMQPKWNGLRLGKALAAETGLITAELPLGLSLKKVSDQSVNISKAIDEFMIKFTVALVVVMIVSLIGLGWRVGLVIAAAVPLTLAGVFVIMQMTGRELDRITLGSLILALGLLVDDAIIAIEMLVVKMEEGWNRVRAAAYAWTATAGPMLSGTLVTVIGLMPVGFASSTAGEYAGNIFWVVGFALLISWVVAVLFTPFLGVLMLPEIPPRTGGHDAIYNTPRYQRLRAAVVWTIERKWLSAGAVGLAMLVAAAGMLLVPQQFFPGTDRPEVLVEIQLPEGTAIQTTEALTGKVERWLMQQPEANAVTGYIGRGAARFFLSLNPELPDPAFAKIIVLTPDREARDALIHRIRRAVADGLLPQARVRVTSLMFGPPIPSPVAFRISGPDEKTMLGLADKVEAAMRADPTTRQVNRDWGGLVPTTHIILDQARLQSIGLTPAAVSDQLAFQLSGVAVTQVRDSIRLADLVVRTAGQQRIDPARVADLSIRIVNGQVVPLSQIGRIEVRMESQILRRRDRMPTLTLRADPADGVQAPYVTARIERTIQPLIDSLPAGYHVERGGFAEESDKANRALAEVFPVMLILMLLVIMVQVRSFAMMIMVLLTAPLGIIGVVPTLLLFGQPFGFNAILGLIGLAGILMRNTLILVGQIQANLAAGLDQREAVIEATVQRARPVILTALAAVMAFVPLTFSSFLGAMAFTLIGGTAGGTIVTLFFLPALYAIFMIKTPGANSGMDKA